MMQRRPDYKKWFRETGYEKWLKRAQRVIKAARETKVSEEELRELQRFVLEFGHFNANFTLEELDGLLYPKSPMATMSVHSYLRSHQNIPAEILRHHFYAANNIKQPTTLYPLFLDSSDFWKDVTHYCHVVKPNDQDIFTSTDPKQSDIWVMLPGNVSDAETSYRKALNTIRETRIAWLIENRVPAALQKCISTTRGREFDESLHKELDDLLREELAQIKAIDESNNREEVPYDQMRKKEKNKWVSSKYGCLHKHNKAFLSEHNIQSVKDLEKFADTEENRHLLIQTVAIAEADNRDEEKARHKASKKKKERYNRAVDAWFKNQLTIFNQSIYYIVPGITFMGIETMVIVGFPDALTNDFAGPKQIVNLLGYRAQSSKLIYALLNLYPKLFIDSEQTRACWKILLSTGLVQKLPESEQALIAELPDKLNEDYQEKNTAEHYKRIITALRASTCAADHDLYKKVMLRILKQLITRCNTDQGAIGRIILTEITDHLFLFTNAIVRNDDYSFAQAIRALQSAGELLKLELATTPKKMAPVPLETTVKNKLLAGHPVQQVVTSPYAMRCYLRVIDRCLAENPGRKVRLAVTSQNWFESTKSLGAIHNGLLELKKVNNSYFDGFDGDILVTELDPNSSTNKRLFQQNLTGLIRRLEKRDDEEESFQFTLVLDTTLNSIDHPIIASMLDDARSLIDCGTLNIIILQSLTKFSQPGLDQCNGGVSIVINSGRDWKALNQYYADIAKTQTVDTVASRYFDFFGGMVLNNSSQGLTADYIQRIERSTNSLYTALLNYAPNIGSGQDNLIRLVPTTEFHLCYIALNTSGILAAIDPQFKADPHDIEVFNNHLKDHLLLPICRKFQLPLTSRQSIGFPLSSVTGALDALRFTVGDESLPTIVKYASILSYIVSFISNHQDLASLFIKDNDNIYSIRLAEFQRAVDIFCADPQKACLLNVSEPEGIIYGPYIQQGEEFYVARSGSDVAVYHKGTVSQELRLNIYQYDTPTHVMKMTKDQLDFIFDAAYYKEFAMNTNVAQAFQAAHSEKKTLKFSRQLAPVLKDTLKFYMMKVKSESRPICQIKYDEHVAKQTDINIYQRQFGNGLYVIDIDYWGKEDSVNSRFLNLCTALYVKQRYKCHFKVRGIPGRNTSMYQRFLFFTPFDFKITGGAFQEALNVVYAQKEKLLALKKEYAAKPVDPNAKPYDFCRADHPLLHRANTAYFNGPTAYPDAEFIGKVYDTLMISDRYQMPFWSYEHTSFFAQAARNELVSESSHPISFFRVVPIPGDDNDVNDPNGPDINGP